MRLRWILALMAIGCSDPEPAPRVDPPAATTATPEATTWRAPAVVRRAGNHLVGEPSPYLAQHDHNPVDWYPWGEEALALARTRNVPILLSIGYSTCHWCHVMAHESFEDDEVAAYVNEHFVAIKVDREQRPDVDALYLDAVRALGGSTGWPLTVILTPDLVPFYGGTYFPKDRFLGVLRRAHERFAADGADAVARQGRQVFEQLEAAARRAAPDEPLEDDVLDRAFAALAPARDPQLGGFGTRQKFPNAPLLLAELRRVERSGDRMARDHLVLTLEQMMRGGIRDALHGSFHRYAVDRRWHVPHFEKTLYDNAQLGLLYVEAGRALDREDFVRVGREVLDDLVARWQRPDGGFVVGFDADDPGGEGAYYTWTPAELRAVLGDEDGATFATMFGVTDAGERALEGRSVLHRQSPAALRVHLENTDADVDALLARVRPGLLEVRDRRPPPAVDDKQLAAWNGLAIAALATAGRWLDERRYVEAAQRAARFLLERGWDGRRMARGMRDGASLGEGFLDDHALAALGLLRLHAADGDLAWLDAAERIARVVLDDFFDAERRVFLQSAREDAPEGVPLRRPDLDDGVLPSGGSAATLLLLEVGAMAGDRPLLDAGERAARASAERAAAQPFGSGFALVVLDHLLGPRRELVLAGRDDALEAVLRGTHPARVLPIRIPADGAPAALLDRFPALEGKRALEGRATAYVCEIGRCELPTSDPAVLARQLASARVAGHP